MQLGPRMMGTHPSETTSERILCHPQLCLELLLTTALRNRDRIQILWPPLHDVLALILGPNATRTSTEVPPLVREFANQLWRRLGARCKPEV